MAMESLSMVRAEDGGSGKFLRTSCAKGARGEGSWAARKTDSS